jgi:hypothetical protein
VDDRIALIRLRFLGSTGAADEVRRQRMLDSKIVEYDPICYP